MQTHSCFKKISAVVVPISAALAMNLSLAVETAPPADTVIAVVNGVPITQATYDGYLAIRPAGSSLDRRLVVDELVKRELLRQDAVQHGLDKLPAVIADLNVLRENLLVAADLKAAADSMPVRDDELHAFYNSHLKEMTPVEYKARHILVATEEEAKAVIAELDKGGDFIKIAKEKSKDNAVDGGDLGWFTAGQMVKQVADTVIALPKGKYTEQPVHSEFGWHVILHEDTRETPPPTFEAVHDRISAALQRTKLQAFIQRLRDQAKVEIK